MISLFQCTIIFIFICHIVDSIKIHDQTVDLSKEDLNFFFGNDKPKEYSYVHIKSKSREKRDIDSSIVYDPGHIDVVLEDESGEIEFELHPNLELLSSDFKVVVRGYKGVIEQEIKGNPSKKCIYVGSAKGKPDTTAALSSCDGKGFTGVFVNGNASHLIRPARKDKRPKREAREGEMTPDGLHIIHIHDSMSKCGVHNLRAMMAPKVYIELPTDDAYYDEETGTFIIPSSTIKSKRSAFEDSEEYDYPDHDVYKRQSEQYLIETAVFVDDVMYDVVKEREGSDATVQAVEDIVLAIMNGVFIMYNAPSLRTNINLELVRLDIWKSEPEGIDKSLGEITRYLLNFCLWQRDQNAKLNPEGDSDPDHWDHGILLSGLNLWEGSEELNAVIGLAWVAGMCTKSYSCTINEGTSFEAIVVISHEMGHNLNMTHDGSKEDGNNCPKDTYLMSPSTGPGKVTWSVCSNRELERFLDSSSRRGGASCLRDIERKKKGLDFSAQGSLPGELYDIKQQCLVALGTKFSPYVTSKSPYNNICRELWCQNRTHALRTHPAIEGSLCDGSTKHCISGICSTKNVVSSGEPDVTENEILNTKYDPGPAYNDRRSRGYGLRDLLVNIRNMFYKYFLISEKRPSTRLPQWQLEDLSECTEKCGGGWQTGKIVCVQDGATVSDRECTGQLIPASKTTCNTLPCK